MIVFGGGKKKSNLSSETGVICFNKQGRGGLYHSTAVHRAWTWRSAFSSTDDGGCMSGWPVQMLTAKPTCRASRKEKCGRLHCLLTNTQLWFAHKLAHDSSCSRVLSLPQRSVGVGKTNRPANWQEMGKLPPLHPWAGLKGDLLTANVTFCKNCPLRSRKGHGELPRLPKTEVRKRP